MTIILPTIIGNVVFVAGKSSSATSGERRRQKSSEASFAGQRPAMWLHWNSSPMATGADSAVPRLREAISRRVGSSPRGEQRGIGSDCQRPVLLAGSALPVIASSGPRCDRRTAPAMTADYRR
jgi:hypothetical protein